MASELQHIPWPGWEMIRRIGNGTYGTVYEIRHDLIVGEERAALKVLSVPQNEGEIKSMRLEGMDEEEITQTVTEQAGNVIQEYKNLCELQGTANIVRCNAVHHEFHTDGIGVNVYIMMELLTPLLDKVDELLKTESQIVSFGIDMCNALIACEKKKILHRDIKPGNIFVSQEGIFKLGDFGVARNYDHTTYATKGMGTPSYMAPEVANGGAYNKQADIYSLGIVLYWLLNKHRTPFLPLPPKGIRLHDREEALARRCSGDPIPEPANGSKRLKEIVLKACAFKPEDRYTSATELLADLSVLATVPVDAPPAKAENEETVGPFFAPVTGDASAGEKQPVWEEETVLQQQTVMPLLTPVGQETTAEAQCRKAEEERRVREEQDRQKKALEERERLRREAARLRQEREETERIQREKEERMRAEQEQQQREAKEKTKKSKTWKYICLMLIAVIAVIVLTVAKDAITKPKDNAGGSYNADILKSATVGDYVYFGSYEQDNNTTNGKEPIEWLVLDVEKDKMLVISKYVLDCKPYHTSARYVSWETCTLRYWLKFSFIHDAFTDEEKEMIPTVTTYSTSVDRSNYESRDRVFLLSTPEANEYFDSDSARICQPTDFAIANGVYTTENANSCWWSRSIAQEAISAAYVDSAGRLARYGYKFSRDDIGVRPAIWIDISSLG